jgi:hypothetical protein
MMVKLKYEEIEWDEIDCPKCGESWEWEDIIDFLLELHTSTHQIVKCFHCNYQFEIRHCSTLVDIYIKDEKIEK